MNRRADGLSVQRQETVVREGGGRERSRKSVYLYVSALFLIVMAFILLSYMIQQRSNTEISALHEKNTTAQQHIENLQEENIRLREENDVYKVKIAELESRINALTNEVDALKKIQDAMWDQAAVNAAGEINDDAQE
jgi:uncharacterized protein YlxW (UPF0749 family)